MPLWRDEPRPTWGTHATLVAVSLVSVASLARVFDGPRYLAWALPGLALGAVITFILGRRSLGAALVVLLGAWVLTLPALFARADSFYLLPSARAVTTIRELLASGVTEAARATAPVGAEARYLILVWTSFLFLGFLGASWLVVRRPVGVVISALGVVAFSGGVGVGPGRDAIAVATVVAAGAFFLSEGRHRIELWGRSSVPAWFGIPTLAAISLFAAAAPFLFGAGALVNLRSVVRPRLVIIKPLSDIKRQLEVDPPIEVLRVTAERPTYWRLTGLDDYDGAEWVLRARPRDVRNGAIPRPDPPPTGDVLTQQYRLTSLLAPWLPAAYAASSISTEAQVEVDAGSQTLLLRGGTSPGLSYTVDSQLPRVTQNLVVPPRGVSDPREQLFGEIAKPIANTRSPLDAARRLESYFKGFNYDEEVAGGHSVQRLQRFLADRRGYCEQFAATMTLMLRGLGFDARVGVGFLPGSLSGGEHIVSTRDAHAWVEANIPGSGWVNFDPTPDRGVASVVPPELEQQIEAPPEVTAVPQPTPVQEDQAGQATETGGGMPVRRFAPYVIAALVLSAPSAAKRIRRSRRRSARPPAAVLGAFAELTDRAADLGFSSGPAETQREFGARLFRTGGSDEAIAACAQLVDITTRSLYGPSAATDRDAAAAWQALPAVLSGLRGRVPGWRRAVAVFDPRTLLPLEAIGRFRPMFLRTRPA